MADGIAIKRTSSPLPFQLRGEDVHVWNARLDQPGQNLAGYFSLLSDDEKARSGRFYFEKDRNYYIVGRALLRLLAAHYLGLPPAGLEFKYTQFGKPFIKSGSNQQFLQFNLSHCNDRAVYIFHRGREVGIDIEQIREMPEQDRFVEFYFSPQEIAFINSLSGREKTTAFFRVWTCKEAILKAIGAGLTKEISQTCVSLSSPALPRVLSLDGDMRQAAGWHLELFTPFDGYQGALAIESQDCSVSFHQVDDQLPGFLTE